MIELVKKIGQGCLLLVMLLALVGVNIKQLYCCHAQNLHWELCLLPDEVAESCDEGCCEEGCCGEKSCHHTTRFDFYKITDFSQIETEPDLLMLPLELSEEWMNGLLVEIAVIFRNKFLKDKWPDRVFLRPLLCTYLC